jgi:hypothetical protein
MNAHTFNKFAADSIIQGVRSGNNDHENNTIPIKYLIALSNHSQTSNGFIPQLVNYKTSSNP